MNYDQPNPAEPLISNWMVQNPQRINLGRIGFSFGNETVTETNLSDKSQTLDLYSGTIVSRFEVSGSQVKVKTSVDPGSDSVAIQVESDLLRGGQLGVFFDYPYPDVNKFDAPFVGVWNATSQHTTSLQKSPKQAHITHTIDTTTYYTAVQWSGNASINGPLNSTHRYVLQPRGDSSLDLTINFSPKSSQTRDDASLIAKSSADWWQDYWETGAFIDLTRSQNENATELQRRIILSQYLLAVNEAGQDPPQESGLVNNGWYGKFHLEMVVWHLMHWGRWGKWALLNRSMPGVYERFLPTSIQRAQDQGYAGARWGKMSDPRGRSAPGEINSLLIWQQPHPFYLAENEYRAFPNQKTLQKWDEILTETAEFMVSFAWYNTSTGIIHVPLAMEPIITQTGFYDLGPPMYPVSENTSPNATFNPTFELAYWRFGLTTAAKWKTRQHLPVPTSWLHVAQNLAPLPIINNTYPIYQDIPNMWTDPTTVSDHPAMLGIFGLLPPSPDLNLTVMRNTADKIASVWDLANLYGWDFPLLAMNAARLGRPGKAVEYLLDANFVFDDVGMPVGGPRVATPYFPAAGGLLLAVAMMAGGWDGSESGSESVGKRFPGGWRVDVEGFEAAL